MSFQFLNINTVKNPFVKSDNRTNVVKLDDRAFVIDYTELDIENSKVLIHFSLQADSANYTHECDLAALSDFCKEHNYIADNQTIVGLENNNFELHQLTRDEVKAFLSHKQGHKMTLFDAKWIKDGKVYFEYEYIQNRKRRFFTLTIDASELEAFLHEANFRSTDQKLAQYPSENQIDFDEIEKYVFLHYLGAELSTLLDNIEWIDYEWDTDKYVLTIHVKESGFAHAVNLFGIEPARLSPALSRKIKTRSAFSDKGCIRAICYTPKDKNKNNIVPSHNDTATATLAIMPEAVTDSVVFVGEVLTK